ncbi:dTDP-4-dehydrorhamnose 3,5-epimerase [Limimaricola litoreus]|uniref:dTDP-4-dehydrorhamnose 3,5-epimerase n=1 Tax=Limimaricola litoreus TaxID=2955316 RepID=A0A9X2FTU7_9RHOB|nr:dTDP-4-dehydrorhamnose 3,5-epimerase [Limimaricola litoreus]MCP1170034.1 dTDP-4-dehydrorhamnose 3,5-epimerase [Limimaricola litoreus]
MLIEKTALPGVLAMTPRRFGDHRGYFSESWSRAAMSDAGIEIDFVQDNHSLSATPGTVRGLHFQAPPRAQHKLVRCGRGALLDVAVDIRRGSPNYGRWTAVELTEQNGRQLLVPAGFAHGFITRLPDTEIVYKCSDGYAPETEGALLWNDPDLGIDWQLDQLDSRTEAVLSEKDAMAARFEGFESPFSYDAPLPWETPS